MGDAKAARPLLDGRSWASSQAARNTMQANRSRDTGPEMRIRRELHAKGYRYRVDARPIPHLNRRADIVFFSRKVAVFIDGCFWHGCADHYSGPKTNSSFWNEKVLANMARDQDTNEKLQESGWSVYRFWEHEPTERAVEKIQLAVGAAKR